MAFGFIDFAKEVLESSDRPLSVEEMWEAGCKRGLDGKLGSSGKTLRRRIGYKKKVEWLCSTYIEEGKQACPGVRIPDELARRQDIIEPTVAEEVYRNGKKYYRYTSKAEFDSRERESRAEEETAGGGILPGEYRPRRTAIKL